MRASGPAVDICKLRAPEGGKGQLVAVKRLRPNSQIDLSQLANEGKILRSLRHRYAVCGIHLLAWW